MEPYLPLLKEKFGFNAFRDGQFQIIKTLLEEKKDVCGILATGQGKSLCYQFPAIFTKKTSIVISPLLSLMEDQKMALLAKNITCQTLSGMTRNYLDACSSVVRGEYSVVYTTPEFIQNHIGLLHEMQDRDTLGLIAIDEAHCISQWGHDFRPSYRKLIGIRQDKVNDQYLNVPILTLTATATPTIIKDICKNLDMKNPKIIQTSVYRRNLSIWVKQKSSSPSMPEIREILGKPSLYINQDSSDEEEKLNSKELKPGAKKEKKLNFKKRAGDCLIDDSDDEDDLEVKIVQPEDDRPPPAGHGDSVIIYTSSRKDSEKICAVLKKYNYPVEYYHAGLSDRRRQEVHENFIYDRTPIVCATIAFGMGIDKPSIRKIINWGMPANLETYYQEIGRAGRDGLESSCYLFYNAGDLAIHKFLIGKMEAGRGVQDHHLHLLNIMRQWAETTVCRQYQIAQYFEKESLILEQPSEEESKKFCLKCDNCLAQQNGDDLNTAKINIAREAKLFISLVEGLYTNYGFKNLIGILTGSQAKSFPNKLKYCQWYSQGDYHSQAYWRALGDLLMDYGYLKYTKVGGLYGGRGSKVFQVVSKGKKNLELDENGKLMVIPNAGLRQHIKSKKSGQNNMINVGGTLLSELKHLRIRMSNEMNLPPYLVLSDPVINCLLNLKSSNRGSKISLRELSVVDGINAQVVLEYGDELLDLIN